MSIFTPLSGSNIYMNYGYLSYVVEIVTFLSDAVARQHRMLIFAFRFLCYFQT